MRSIIVLLFCLFIGQLSFGQQYQRLHQQSILIDTHNDILTNAFEKQVSFDQELTGKTHSDLQRMKEGGVDIQIFSVWCDGLQQQPFAYANRQIDTLYAWVNRNPTNMMLVKTTADIKAAIAQKKFGAMIGVEGGHMIENDMRKLDSLFKRGARYMTLTWNNSNPWATSAMEETKDSLLHQPKGLSAFGKKLVEHMNDIGMLVDISHVGEATFWDVMNTTTKPVIASHSSAYALCPVFRNLKDDQLQAIGKNGGVVQVNFYSRFLDSNYNRNEAAFTASHKAERDSLLQANPEPYFADLFLFEKYAAEVNNLKAPLSLLVNHIVHIARVAGIDHVGIGSDFDGINSTPQQLYDVTTYPLLTKALLQGGFSKKDVRKILGGNFMRVFFDNSEL